MSEHQPPRDPADATRGGGPRASRMHDARMMDARPRIVASQCLGFAAVRYNGAIIRDDFVQRLAQHVDIIEVCPEVGIGLGVPRDPIRIERSRGVDTLFQPATGRDITADMHTFAADFTGSLPDVDGFILKSRSPSCGLAGVSVFDGHGDTVDTTPGMFARVVMESFPNAAVEDEISLRDIRRRRGFLTRVYATARLRTAERRGRVDDLSAFHSLYHDLLTTSNASGAAALDDIVARASTDRATAFALYRTQILAILAAAVDEFADHPSFHLFPGELQ